MSVTSSIPYLPLQHRTAKPLPPANPMTHRRSRASAQLRRGVLILAAALAGFAARADEYSDVGQLLRTGKLLEAQARVERHLATHPRDPQMRFYRGVIQRESGRLAEALVTFTQLSEDHPEWPEPYNNAAVIHASQGQYEKARVALEKALRTHPSYATAHDNLGDVYARLASQAYSKALQLDGAAPPPQPRLALIRDLPAPTGTPPRPLLAAAQPAPAAPAATPAAPVTAPAVPVTAPTAAPAPVKPVVTVAAATAAPPGPPPAVTIPAAPAAAAPNASQAVEMAVRAWARAWADKDMPQYLAAYGPDFETPGRVPRSTWEQDRRLRITGKSRIAVNLQELQIRVQGDRAVAKFRQDYKADALAVLSRKTLTLVKTGDRWLIVKETSGS